MHEDPSTLEALARLLNRQAAMGQTLTYRDATLALGLEPPNTIHQLVMLLEELMQQDAEAERPLRASLVVSRTRNGRPAPGFFDRAQALGLFDGYDADAFHEQQLARLLQRVPGQSSSASA